ncbi:hypothetical protein EDEG_03506 [Edhazardia aedis USNM 41457]|uniref:Nudix hydrolase domain-containing protein n=1 Tax=Edhazardia aedis (strain USNM 41457) TaxID=1003232 RepID=J8ZQT3_EDHAE|nr:hypothetical protein EDEG_03506 [Edhazardia aedis USNM 41457]|eukprot:EJW02043.1 hypothetical protein EDEG_03506 [Edhazardia aedis USNM 41457]
MNRHVKKVILCVLIIFIFIIALILMLPQSDTHLLEIKRAGAVVFIPNTKKFVLVKSTKNGMYVMPKGSIKSKESAKDAALREVLEECGAKGKIIGEIMKLHDVVWYFMVVKSFDEDYLEVSWRERRFLSYYEVLHDPNVRTKAKDVLRIAAKKWKIK